MLRAIKEMLNQRVGWDSRVRQPLNRERLAFRASMPGTYPVFS